MQRPADRPGPKRRRAVDHVAHVGDARLPRGRDRRSGSSPDRPWRPRRCAAARSGPAARPGARSDPASPSKIGISTPSKPVARMSRRSGSCASVTWVVQRNMHMPIFIAGLPASCCARWCAGSAQLRQVGITNSQIAAGAATVIRVRDEVAHYVRIFQHIILAFSCSRNASCAADRLCANLCLKHIWSNQIAGPAGPGTSSGVREDTDASFDAQLDARRTAGGHAAADQEIRL